MQIGRGDHRVSVLGRRKDTKHVMNQVFHELIAIVINAMKELLMMGMDDCGGKFVRENIITYDATSTTEKSPY